MGPTERAVATISSRERRRTALLERESADRVITCLEHEAELAPTPMMRALWRRLAANTRREMLVSPD